MKELLPEERLIVAADFVPESGEGPDDIWQRVMKLAHELRMTGVWIKVESTLRLRGYELINELHDLNLKVMADLKLYGTPKTLMMDGRMLSRFKPEIVTVSCSTGREAMVALKAQLPRTTEVLGVTVPTTQTWEDTRVIHRGEVLETVSRLVQLAWEAGLDGVVCAPAEAAMVRGKHDPSFMIVSPDIIVGLVVGDSQNQRRAGTVAEAIRAGANRIVVGRAITEASKPYEVVSRIIDEIEKAMPLIEL